MEDLEQDVGSDAHCTVEENNSNSDDLVISTSFSNFKEAAQVLEDVQTFLKKTAFI